MAKRRDKDIAADGKRRPKVWHRAFIAALVAVAVSPTVAVALSSGMPPAIVALLNQLSGFGTGFLTNIISDIYKARIDSTGNDDPASVALEVEIAERILKFLDEDDDPQAAEARQHLRVLLANDPVLEALIDVSRQEGDAWIKAVHEGELRQGLIEAGAGNAEWLLEEVFETLDQLARQPSPLFLALERLVEKLQLEEHESFN